MAEDTPLSRLAGLAPLVRAHRDDGRRARRLPQPLVDAINEHGLFRLWVPQRYGGHEMPLPEALEIYEAAARLDGSFGWSVMIGAGGGLFAAYLPPAGARALFSARGAVVAGSGAAGGVADRISGGYRVRGRWRYASGAEYATIFTANCRVTERGQPVLAGTEPLIRAMAFDPKDVTIHRTWNTSGLRATGSHDIEVSDVFVPAGETFSVITDSPRESGPLYRIPFGTLTELPVSAVALGIAQNALAEFAALAQSKRVAAVDAPLARLAAVQDAMRAARAGIDQARRTLYQHARLIWDAAATVGQADRGALDDCTRACVHQVRSLVAAIADLVPLAGMNALQIDDAFAIGWRDLEATAAHYSVSPLCLSSGPQA